MKFALQVQWYICREENFLALSIVALTKAEILKNLGLNSQAIKAKDHKVGWRKTNGRQTQLLVERTGQKTTCPYVRLGRVPYRIREPVQTPCEQE